MCHRKNYYTIGLFIKKKSAWKRSSSIYATNTISEFVKLTDSKTKC